MTGVLTSRSPRIRTVDYAKPAGTDEWRSQARCRGVDTEVFYQPDHLRGAERRERENRAKALCKVCPVAVACLEWAMVTAEPAGVWGGTTPRDRDELRFRAAAGRLPVA